MNTQTSDCKVLVIESNNTHYRAIRRVLEVSNISFAHDRIKSLEEARHHLKHHVYHVILLSMYLPDANAVEALPILSSLLKKQPILVVSHDSDMSLAALQAGAFDIIPSQSFNNIPLISRILLSAHERSQQLHQRAFIDQENYLAYYDQVTSLPNRALFFDRLNQALDQAKRHEQQFFIFYVRLSFNLQANSTSNDNKDIIASSGNRLLAEVRSSDTVAHVNYSEFAILLQRSNSLGAMEKLATKMINSINQPIQIGQHAHPISSNIGIVNYPTHGSNAEELVKNAELAMHNARLHGPNQIQMYADDLLTRQAEILNLTAVLNQALKNPDEHFQLYYQPRVDLSSGNIRTVEALIRWRHPNLGNIPPEQFIPLAEEAGLIEQVDQWVIEQACQQLTRWHTIQSDLKIAINVSHHSLKQANFVDTVIVPLLSRYQINGNSISIEVSDSVLATGSSYAWQSFTKLAELGVAITLDDFGKHLISLRKLSASPVEAVSIDTSFLCDAYSTKTDQALLKAIIDLGKNLQIKVIAKSVETKNQLDYLTSLQCDEGQGFYWFKPARRWMPQPHRRKAMTLGKSSG
ncbi:GGDEF and EAL domain-containing protein [Marinomonas agarivorans]|nr:GGDEF and EAL domain-containing protein [Marinomonas agarivorans]